MADARNIVKIILLLLGEQAAKVRLEASRVFVGFLGGNLAAARLTRTFCRATSAYILPRD